MKNAGYQGFERGERGSTAEHLTVLEYKTQHKAMRAKEMTAIVEQKQIAAADLDDLTEKKQKRLDNLDEKISVKTKAVASIAEVESMGKSAVFGGFNVTAEEMKKFKSLAKKGIAVEDNTRELKRQLKAKNDELAEVKAELASEAKKRPTIKEHLNWWEKFITAMRRAPKRLMAVIDEILWEPPERKEPEKAIPEQKQNRDIAL